MEKGEVISPCSDDNQHGCDKRTSLRALNDAFLDTSIGKDPQPYKQKKYVEVCIQVLLKLGGGQERQRQIEGTICSLKWKKQQG
jgi:hypothetical protein